MHLHLGLRTRQTDRETEKILGCPIPGEKEIHVGLY